MWDIVLSLEHDLKMLCGGIIESKVMVVEGITNDISLRHFPVAASAADLPTEQVTAPRTIEAVQKNTTGENENEQQPAGNESATNTKDLLINVLSEAELLRAQSEASLYTLLDPVQINQPSTYAATVSTPKRVIVLGTLVIDIHA